MFNAEAYKVVGYNYATAGLEEREIFDAQTDYNMFSSVEYSDDNSAKTNPFQPLRGQKLEWSLGVSKKWSSGTNTTIQWVHDNNQLEFDSSLGGFSGSFINEYKQSAVVVQLEQNLLKATYTNT